MNERAFFMLSVYVKRVYIQYDGDQRKLWQKRQFIPLRMVIKLDESLLLLLLLVDVVVVVVVVVVVFCCFRRSRETKGAVRECCQKWEGRKL